MNKNNKMENKKIIVFDDEKIRRIWHEGEWYFSVVDVVRVLSGSSNPRDYWYKLKIRELEHDIELSTFCRQLKLEAPDGKMRETDCANKRGIFRIIQSIPSKKAEPFKLWLSQIGSDRIDEVIDPELSIDRAMKTYLKKGYSKEWINQRLKTIEVRTPQAYPEKFHYEIIIEIFTGGKELTDEWNRVGIDDNLDYAILTNDITLAWSGKSVNEYKDLKNLKQENLRDNMTNLELILNMLAEASTTEISKKENPKYFDESRLIGIKGGQVAKVARDKIEKDLGESIVTSKNADDLIKDKKIKKKKEIIIKDEK